MVLTAVALLVGTLALGTRLGSEFLPELDEGSIWLTATLDPSTSLAEAQQQSRRIRELVGTFLRYRRWWPSWGARKTVPMPRAPIRSRRWWR